MDSRFEITIILSLIIAIATMLYAYRKKSDREDSLFGNCDSWVDKIAVAVFSAFYILPSLGITFILLVLWKMDYMLIVFLIFFGWIIIPLALEFNGVGSLLCKAAERSACDHFLG